MDGGDLTRVEERKIMGLFLRSQEIITCNP